MDQRYQDLLDRINAQRKFLDRLEKAVIAESKGEESESFISELNATDYEEEVIKTTLVGIMTELIRRRYVTKEDSRMRERYVDIYLENHARLKSLLSSYPVATPCLRTFAIERLQRFYGWAIATFDRYHFVNNEDAYRIPDEGIPEMCPWTFDDILTLDDEVLIAKL